MKKLSSFMLAILITLTVPVMGSPGFIEGQVLEITKSDYDAINIREFTLNNSSFEVEGLGTFYSDDRILNTWYLDVNENVEGAINIAYRIGTKYYNAKFTIKGSGLYRVGDSRGSNGVNAVKIGKFEKKSKPVITYEIADGWDPNILGRAYNHQAYAFIFYVNKLEDGVVVATNKHVEHFRVHQGMVTIRYDEGYRVRFKWDNHVMLSVKIV